MLKYFVKIQITIYILIDGLILLTNNSNILKQKFFKYPSSGSSDLREVPSIAQEK